MNHRIDRTKDKFAGGRQSQIDLTVRIGYDADFHLCIPLFSSWHLNRRVYISLILNQCERRFK